VLQELAATEFAWHQSSLKELINYGPFLKRFINVKRLINVNLSSGYQKIGSQLLFLLKIGS